MKIVVSVHIADISQREEQMRLIMHFFIISG